MLQKSPASAASLSVSIVTHNSALTLLGGALSSLENAAGVAREQGRLGDIEVAIIDNASEPGYREQLEAMLAPWVTKPGFAVKYLPQVHNRGFGAGHNKSLDRVDSDYHLILNPDVELDPHALLNGLERLHGEIKRRTDVVGIFPNEASIRRLVGAILMEQTEEWTVQRGRYLTLETLAPICDDASVSLPAAQRD